MTVMTGQVAPAIFFLHCPKAGGTALKSRFDRAFAPHEISPTIEVIPSERDPSAWANFAGFKFASGHCGYEVYRAIGAKHLLVTNFRQPVARIVSLYDYWRNNFPDDDGRHSHPVLNASRFAKTMTFAEFIRSDELAIKLYVHNAHSRQILSSAWQYRELNFIDLFTLKRRVKRMHWFYICEKSDLSENWLRYQLPEIAALPLAIENATNYSEAPKTIPTADDIELLHRYNAHDLAIYDFAADLLQQRLRKLAEPSRRRLGYRRVANGLSFISRLPRTIAQIEGRIASLENGGVKVTQIATPALAVQPTAVPEPVAIAEPAAIAAPVTARSNGAARTEGKNVRYLAYAEQIPRDRPVYIVGLDKMAAWTLRLLRSRGYTIEAFIADVPDPPEHYHALPVLQRADKFKELSRDDVILIASPHRDSLVGEFEFSDNLFDVTELFQYVTEFCEKDPNGILLDDLAISYWRATPAQVDKYGDVWRRLKKQPAHQYVRNIENAAGQGSRFVVNVGSGGNTFTEPCQPLLADGWTGRALGAAVTPANINQLLSDDRVPHDCDLIRVNTGSYDGPVLQAILEGGWRPRVFCVEINSDIPPPFRFAVHFNEAEQLAEWDDQALRNIGLFGCSAAWASALLQKFGYSFAQYEFGFPKAIGGAHYAVFIRDDVFDASQATPGIAWDDAYYAEPLAWSPIKSNLKIDIRDWRHPKNPVDQAAAMKVALHEGAKKTLGREVSFLLEC